MEKKITELKKHLSDMKSAQRSILANDIEHSMDFLLKLGDILKDTKDPDYMHDVERLTKVHTQTVEITKNIKTKVDKCISDLESEINKHNL